MVKQDTVSFRRLRFCVSVCPTRLQFRLACALTSRDRRGLTGSQSFFELAECTSLALCHSIQRVPLSSFPRLAVPANLLSIHSFKISAPLSVSVLLRRRAPHPRSSAKLPADAKITTKRPPSSKSARYTLLTTLAISLLAQPLHQDCSAPYLANDMTARVYADVRSLPTSPPTPRKPRSPSTSTGIYALTFASL